MKKFMTMIATAAMLAGAAPQALAEDPVMPPFQQPSEEWTLYYDNYRSLWHSDPSYRNKTHNVLIVRDNNDVYIKGLFSEYPESWIKCTAEGSVLSVKPLQLIDNEDGETVYFHCGDVEYDWSDGNTYRDDFITFTQERNAFYLDITEYGNSMTARKGSYDIHKAFWYDATDSDKLELLDGYRRDVYDNLTPIEPGFPDSDFMINVKFKKIGVSGIQGIGSDNDAAAPMYDLQGRVVDPAAAAPGIYIRNGKKIVMTGR